MSDTPPDRPPPPDLPPPPRKDDLFPPEVEELLEELDLKPPPVPPEPKPD